MERLSSTDSGFWTTIDLLIERKWRDKHDVNDEYPITNKLCAKSIERTRRRLKKENSIHPEHDYLENEPDTQFVDQMDHSGRMQRLHDRLHRLAEEELQKRITARQMKEMDRLKKLILSGKSPLKDCPPELREHPVFVFWRVMDKEVEKISKAKSDAHHKKYKRSRRKNSNHDPTVVIDSEESSLCTDELLGMNNDDTNNNNNNNNYTMSSRSNSNPRYTPQGITHIKYEDEGIKELREKTTVEELYQMADQIIGICRVVDASR